MPAVCSLEVGVLPSDMVIVAGVLPINTLVAPSPIPPTKVFCARRTEIGTSVFSRALKRMTAIDPVPFIGFLTSVAPTLIDALPRSIVPDVNIFGNSALLVMDCDSSFAGSNMMCSSAATTWFSPVSRVTSRENVSPGFLVREAGENANVVAGAAFFLSSWFCPARKIVAGMAKVIRIADRMKTTFFIGLKPLWEIFAKMAREEGLSPAGCIFFLKLKKPLDRN